jgi:hypothetical protein
VATVSGSQTLNTLETAMNLTTGEMALIFAGCVLAIGVIVVLWRRGVFAPKTTGTLDTGANPAPTGEAK